VNSMYSAQIKARYAAIVLIAAGCLNSGGEIPSDVDLTWTATDSVGVTLVQQVLDTARVLGLEEVWRIGSLDGDESTQFFSPRDGAFGPSGEIYVLDSGNHRVKVFSEADGSLLHAFGSEGNGPGEFQQQAVSMDLGDGKIVVLDAARRLHTFEPGGELVETLSLTQSFPPGFYPGAFRWAGDSWLLSVAHLFDPEAGRQVDRQPTRLYSLSIPGGPGDPTGLGWDAGVETESIGAMGWIISPIYQQRPHTYLDGTGRLYRVLGDSYGWEIYTRDGALEGRVTNAADRLPVLQADLDRYEENRREQCRGAPAQSECHAFVNDALPAQMAMEEPDFQPAIYQLDGSSRGDLLVLRADLGYDVVDRFQSKTYDLFAPDGRFRGRFTRGPGFRVIAVTEDRLLAIERDDLDVESVVLYDLAELKH
jgi:6-bladed beta-propeller